MVIGAVGPSCRQLSMLGVSFSAHTLKDFSIDTGLGTEQPDKIATVKITILFRSSMIRTVPINGKVPSTHIGNTFDP